MRNRSMLTARQRFIRVDQTQIPNGAKILMGQVNEIGFQVCWQKSTGLYEVGPINEGTPTSVNIDVPGCQPGWELGLFHTHPGGVAIPSSTDIRSAKQVGADFIGIEADGQLETFKIF